MFWALKFNPISSLQIYQEGVISGILFSFYKAINGSTRDLGLQNKVHSTNTNNFCSKRGFGVYFFFNSTNPPILLALQGVLDFKYGIYVHFTYQLKIFYKDYMLRSRILFSFYKTNNILVKKEVLGFNVGIYVHSTNLPTILALQGGLGFETKFIDC